MHFSFFLDDVGQLNAQEKAFVEDPANAHLFDDPTTAENKRAREHESPVPGMAKKSKPSYDKVSGRVDFNTQSRVVRKHIDPNFGKMLIKGLISLYKSVFITYFLRSLRKVDIKTGTQKILTVKFTKNLKKRTC